MYKGNTTDNNIISKIGLGGGCHWCTEGIFESLLGITTVNQGWIASIPPYAELSEAIEVFFNPTIISLQSVIEVHLHTHSSTSNHAMRKKYRSAIYTYNDTQNKEAKTILTHLENDFDKLIITQVLPLKSFKMNKDKLVNYLYKSPNKPFCQTYIHPKLKLLLTRFKRHVNEQKLAQSGLILSD